MERAVKKSKPFFNILPVIIRIFEQNCPDIFKVSESAGEDFMNDDIFKCGKSDFSGTNPDRDRPFNRLAFIGSKGKNKVNSYSSAVIGGR